MVMGLIRVAVVLMGAGELVEIGIGVGYRLSTEFKIDTDHRHLARGQGLSMSRRNFQSFLHMEIKEESKAGKKLITEESSAQME